MQLIQIAQGPSGVQHSIEFLDVSIQCGREIEGISQHYRVRQEYAFRCLFMLHATWNSNRPASRQIVSLSSGRTVVRTRDAVCPLPVEDNSAAVGELHALWIRRVASVVPSVVARVHTCELSAEPAGLQ